MFNEFKDFKRNTNKNLHYINEDKKIINFQERAWLNLIMRTIQDTNTNSVKGTQTEMKSN